MPSRPPAVRPRRSIRTAVALVAAAVIPATVLTATPAVAADIAPFDAVNLFIGTELDTGQNKSNDAYGNTYPGAALPFGMVQPSPTTYKTNEPNGLVQEKGGYEYTADQIRGFGMTRYSGTGCHTRFGGYEFPTIPFTGALAADGALPRNPSSEHRSYFLGFEHANETAEPGYYAVTTDDGTGTELTATDRTAVSRFDFSGAEGSTLILDASGANNRTFEVSIDIDPETRTVSGSMFGTDVCDNGNHYRAYFSTSYDQAFESFGTWTEGAMTAGSESAQLGTGDTGSDLRHKTGGWVTFADDAIVTAKTGFSYVSVENAAENRELETAAESFDQVRADARAAWEEALGTIDVAGGTEEERVKLYTALYHSLLQPTIGHDVDGSYLGFDGAVHEIEQGRDFFRRINFAGQGWDMYRSQAQLIAMLFPEVANDINRSIVLLTQQTGKWSPGAARMSGDNYQVILSTLDAFGATDYDRRAALDSMVATQSLPATDSTRSNAFQHAATGLIESRKGDNATSRVLEYAIDDFSIAQLAQRLGDEEAYDAFMVRAQSWQNVFDPETDHIRPRDRSSFNRGFNLADRGDQFNQSTGYQYGWMVPHNIGTLVERRGGVAASTRALDVLMAQLDAGAYTQTGNYLSNEAAFTTPWVYHWLQAPHEATDVLHRAVTEMYDTTPSGLPGNDDEGALSSWYVFANLGIAPMIHGTANLLVTAPMFESITIDSVGSDRVYQINAPGAGQGAKYTTALSVDGVPRTASWLGEDFARDGGRLDFTLAATPGDWGTAADDVPPSFTDGLNERNNVGTAPSGSRFMGSMDLSDWAFSRETLAAAGAAPGAELPLAGTDIVFTWPDTEPGEPDNWIPNGQRVDVEDQQAGAISFLGLATNGPSNGTAVVEYTDGSTQDVPFQLLDWSASANAANIEVVKVDGRVNSTNGTNGGGAFRLFGTAPIAIDATKTVAAVRLPEASYNGLMHIFDIGFQQDQYVDPNAPKGEPERVVLNPSEDPSTSQYVTWRTSSSLPIAGEVEIRQVGGAVRTVAAESKPQRLIGGYPTRSHSALVDDLEPGTEYEYRVGAGEQRSGWQRFTTAAAEAQPFTFLYFGDAQEGIDTVWPESVRRATDAEPDAELALYAGDMVNVADNDGEWEDWFAGAEPLLGSTQSLTTVGNHEIGGPLRNAETFVDSFEYAANGPVAADAGRYASVYGEHLAQQLHDSVYFTDYQGVRFVNLNANRDDICQMVRPAGAPDDCDQGRQAWMTMQATWLDRVLQENPNDWSVVMAHQPVYSTGISGNGLRDEQNWRQHILPVIETNNVDLVLQGHDHTYGRGYSNATATGIDGVTAGPVFVVSNAGQKQYSLPSADDNIWTRNNATAVTRAQDTSTFQRISVDGDTLSYESTVTYTRPGGAATLQAGDTLDRFTITKRADGAKWVTEAGVDAPGADVAPVNVEQPFDGGFDDATFGEVVFDDDFSTDRLGEYTTFAGQGEAEAALNIDTEAGVLRATADGRRWSNLQVPVEAGESFAIIVEPETFAGRSGGEDTMFLGLADGVGDRAQSWYHHPGAQGGFENFSEGSRRGLTEGPASTTPVRWSEGDRFATVLDQGELSSWIEQDGEWTRITSSLMRLWVPVDELSTWKPTVGLRLDPGAIALDQVTVLRGGGVAPTPVVPAEVRFMDPAGTASDRYIVPATEGVEYLLDDEVVAAGSYPGSGAVTVTARALDGFVLAEGAQASWSFVFTDLGDPGVPTDPTDPTDPGTPGEPGEPGEGGEVDPGTEQPGAVPAAPSSDDLTAGNRGEVDAPDQAIAGGTIVVRLDPARAGQTVWGWLFSEPRALGSAVVNAAGQAAFPLPADVEPGEHRIAILDADGELIGWDQLTVVSAGDLSDTGATVLLPAGIALALLLLGAALVVVRRRRTA